MIEKALVPIDKLISKYASIDNRLKLVYDALSYSQELLDSTDRINSLKSDI
jgi:hypothetical protein